jgi:CheY-like chemotaxis protein
MASTSSGPADRAPTPTPSLVVTGFASEASRAAALAADAAGYLAKPFAASNLRLARAGHADHSTTTLSAKPCELTKEKE